MIDDKNFKQIQLEVARNLQNTSTSTTNANDILPKIKDWINQRYERLLRAYPWQELLDTYTLTTTANTPSYALNKSVWQVVKVFDSTNGHNVEEESPEQYYRLSAPVVEVSGNVQTGQVDFYHQIGLRSVTAALTANSTVYVQSSSASDVSPLQVRIAGLSGGTEVVETITVTGTSIATSTYTYDSGAYLQISMGYSGTTETSSVGVISVIQTSNSATISKIGPGENAPHYQWIKFRPTPASASTLTILAKRRVRRMSDNSDAPVLPCGSALVIGATTDGLWEDGQDQIASIWEEKFSIAVKELWSSKIPRNLRKQAIPVNSDNPSHSQRIFWG